MNQVHCLYLISKRIQIPDIYNWKLEQSKLINEGYLDLSGKVTDNGKKLLKKFNDLFDSTRAITTTEVLGEDYKANIETFRNMFPTKVGNRAGIRSSESQLIPKFEWFFKKHPEVTWEEVIGGTKLYIDTVESRYIRNAAYFIKKSDTDKTWVSDLASYAEQFRGETKNPVDNRYDNPYDIL